MAISDTFIPVHYNIQITNPGGLTAPDDGFIDHARVYEYARDPADPYSPSYATGTWPTTNDLCVARERGYSRWLAILREISLTIAPYPVINTVTHGSDPDTEGLDFTFDVFYDRPEYLRTEDTENAPGTYLTGTAAVARWIARALSRTYTESREVYYSEVPSGGIQVQGSSWQAVTVGPLFADVNAAESGAWIVVTDLSVDYVW